MSENQHTPAIHVPATAEQWYEGIERRLNALRPSRYNEDDHSWLRPVIDWAEANAPPSVRAQAIEAYDDEEGDQ